jgi:predicted  nucleic acid-binding Zn-ribbon protein
MKRIIFLLAATTILWGCNEKEKQEIETLKQQVQTLKSESIAKDSTINNFFRVLNEIETNISLVMQKEQIIAKNAELGNEMESDTRERIQNDINTINELMARNKQSINYLNKQLKGANFQIYEFEERLKKAQNLLETRDAEVDDLKDRLSQLDFSIESLNATVDTLTYAKEQLEQEVQKHVDELNTAWFAYGTKKELLDNNVTEKVGGFLGIGRSFRLRDDFNELYFTQIDITETTSIPMFAKKATLLTIHPKDSYNLVENENGIIERIEILDNHTFWSTSKYLLIQVD